MRRKLLLVDLLFHEHSRSTEFVFELLKRRFDVTRVYSDAGLSDGAEYRALVAQHKPDLLFLLQVSCSADTLAGLGLPAVWMPMYDNVNKRFDDRFVEAAQVRLPILTFARAHCDIARFWNLPSFLVRYFPEPAPEPDFQVGNNRVLIWYRGPIQPADIAPLLTSMPGLSVVIKHDPDPPYANTPREDGGLAPHIDRIIEGFLPADEYRDLVASCGIYVAPRKAEGIGLSYLEAMARGALIIGYDAPTMNEYIGHGEDGWLFDETNLKPVPGNRVREMRQASYAAVGEGRRLWDESESAILEFVDRVAPLKRIRGTATLKPGFIRTLKRIRSTLKR